MDSEEKLRQEAIRLHLQNVSVNSIARQLSRSRQWVYKWISRYETTSSTKDWYKGISKTPKTHSRRTSVAVERAVIDARKRLASKPYSQQGAVSIMYELSHIGVQAPSISTINRILKRNNLIKEDKPKVSKSKEYPDRYINVQQMDLIGPRYLKGGFKFYIFNIIDIGNHFAGVYPINNKAATSIVPCLIDFWHNYQLPDYLQMDNELSFRGSNRHPRGLGLLLRVALTNNITPVFIPPVEPWRNGVVEKFNDNVTKYFLKQKFTSLEEMQLKALDFTSFHNANHRYSSQNNKTPCQMAEKERYLVKLKQDYDLTVRPSINGGELIFIRFIRSDLKLNILNSIFIVSEKLMYTYVEAVVVIDKHFLAIYHKGKIYHYFEFVMPLS